MNDSAGQVGDGIECEGAFHFKSAKVAQNFDAHVSSQVTGYDEVQLLAAKLGDWFIRDGSTVVDLGASTGTTIKAMQARTKAKNVTWLAYDHSREMAEEATKKGVEVSFLDAEDALSESENTGLPIFPKCDYFISLYTVQFLHPRFRQMLFRQVYESLNTDGVFFLVEKVRCEDAHIFDVLQNIYWESKLVNGYTPDQVFAKARSLRSVMRPPTLRGVDYRLHEAGFEQVELVFRNLLFCGWIAMKTS